MISPYSGKDQYQVLGLNSHANWYCKSGATTPAVGGGITAYSGKDQYQVIGLGTIVDWYCVGGDIPVTPYPLDIAISKSLEYGISISKSLEYGISISKSLEYGISISKTGGGS